MTSLEIQNALTRLETLWKTSQINEAKILANELLELNIFQDSSETLAEVYNILGHIHLHFSDFPKAIEFFNKGLHNFEKHGNKKGIAICIGNIGNVYFTLSDFQKSLENFLKALYIDEEIDNKEGIAKNLVSIGIVYKVLSDYQKALEYCSKALRINEEIGSKEGIALNLMNIGNLYSQLKDFPKSLEYYEKSLELYEQLGNKKGIAYALGNIGSAYISLSNNNMALEFFQKALELFEEMGNKNVIAKALMNIGIINVNLLEYSKALDYSKKALQLFEEIGDKTGIANILNLIGRIFSTKESPMYDCKEAEVYLQKSLTIGEELGAKDVIIDTIETFYAMRRNEERYKEALEYKLQSIDLKDEILSLEAKNQAQQFDQRRKIEDDEKARQLKLARFQEQERIFHNILPISIADRLIDGEQTIAESFENVSIFFSDIVGFTTLSATIEPAELVKGLNTIFTAFDRIGTKYGLEKIKTIGDAYMAVCGVPTEFDNHSHRAANFALEASEVIDNLDLGKEFKNLQIRIGLHCGSVVAGIIGEKKFAYDVWGDAVNVASRMESNSEAGRIHISEQFAKSIEKYLEFSLIPRGEISIKGKGIMKTFWLEKGI